MKNFILKTLAGIMVVMFLLCTSAMDSDAQWIPAIGCIVSLSYLLVFAWANQENL